MRLTAIYRMSDNSYPKERFAFATKLYCLDNFFSTVVTNGYEIKGLDGVDFHILLDDTKLKPETFENVTAQSKEMNAVLVKYTGGSSAASWRKASQYSLELGLSDDSPVYYVEDDYLHRHGSSRILMEGLARADYVSLYDHIDKYMPASKGGNPYVGEDAGEVTKVFITDSCHWKLTNSTTMTFATKIGVLREDKPIWDKWTSESYPQDFNAFIELRQKNRSLITPIPSYSTHCEPKWAAPFVDWRNL